MWGLILLPALGYYCCTLDSHSPGAQPCSGCMDKCCLIVSNFMFSIGKMNINSCIGFTDRLTHFENNTSCFECCRDDLRRKANLEKILNLVLSPNVDSWNHYSLLSQAKLPWISRALVGAKRKSAWERMKS